MKSLINKIIIPTDFSAYSENALKTGLAIAQRQGAEVSILHVMDEFDYREVSKDLLPNHKKEASQFHAIGKYLDMLAARIHSSTGIKISSKVLEGLPSEKICTYAIQQKASLIVMGTYGISGSRELFMGSDAFTVINGCNCPVLSVPDSWHKTTFGKVLFPVQLKPGTFEKYFYARPIIEKNNSEIYILGLAERNKPRELKELATLVDKLKLQMHDDHVKFQSAFSPCTDFPEKVLQVAEEFSADLAIIAVNNANSSKTSKNIPFAQHLINHLKIPVLSIKPISHHIISMIQPEFTGNGQEI